MSGQAILTQWYFHVPNLLMAVMFYMLIVRSVLELVFVRQPDTVLLRVFRTVTRPAVGAVRWITPAIVPTGLVIVFAAAWLFALRVAMFWGFRMAGFKIGV